MAWYVILLCFLGQPMHRDVRKDKPSILNFIELGKGRKQAVYVTNRLSVSPGRKNANQISALRKIQIFQNWFHLARMLLNNHAS